MLTGASRSIAGAAILVGFGFLGSRLLGALRTVVIANEFGASAELYMGPNFSLRVEGNGTLVRNFGSFSSRSVDASAALRAQLGGVFVGAGYRWASMSLEEDRGEDDEFESTLRMRGIFLEIGVRF